MAFANHSFVANRHVYGLQFAYDLEGRRTALTIPDSLRPSSTQTQTELRYAYDGVTGALASITDPLGSLYTFHYRADGAVDTLTAPGGVVETHEYDADGRLAVGCTATRCATTCAVRRRTRTPSGTSQLAYDGLGHMVHSFSNEWSGVKVPESEEQYFYDGLGNKVWHRRTSYAMQVVNTSPVLPTVEYYQPGTGRDTSSAGVPGIYFAGAVPPVQAVARRFDRAGNLIFLQELNPVQLLFGASTGSRNEPKTSYAEPDGMSLATRSPENGQQQVFTDYHLSRRWEAGPGKQAGNLCVCKLGADRWMHVTAAGVRQAGTVGELSVRSAGQAYLGEYHNAGGLRRLPVPLRQHHPPHGVGWRPGSGGDPVPERAS